MNNKEKIIKCRVKSDSTFTDLVGLELDVIRDKAFYKIVSVYTYSKTFRTIERAVEANHEYEGVHIGREQLDFQIEDLNKVKEEPLNNHRILDESINPVREFESGAIRDVDGKEDYVETQSFLAMKRYAEYMTAQAKKYGRGNWRKGIPIEEYEKSLMRHIHKYFANKYDNANLEPDIDHLSAIRFNLDGIIHEEEKLKLNNK